MQNHTQSHESVNAHRRSPQGAGLQSNPGRKGLGDQPQHAQELGVRHPEAHGLSLGQAGGNLGGQRTLALFGLPGSIRVKRKPAVVVTPPTGYGESGKSLVRREAALAGLDQLGKLQAYFAKKDAAKLARDAIRDSGLFADEPRATASQNMVAAASDAREAYPHITDDEHADFLLRCEGAGHVEMSVAMD